MEGKVEVVETNEQPVLSIKMITSVDELPMVIGEAYGKIYTYLGELGQGPVGMPFVGYLDMDMDNLNVEIGFPVAEKLPSKDNMEASLIPGGKKATCIHKGPYKELCNTYDQMSKWLMDNKMNPSGVVYEYYFNSPEEVPESELLTKIVFLLN